MQMDSILEGILDLARWAPSGDNTQPWRFEIVDARHVVIHGFDTRDHCVYDLDGHPSQISLGALLESMAIAASTHGLHMYAQRRLAASDTHPTFDIAFEPELKPAPDPLAGFIRQRSVQRRPMSTRTLTIDEKSALTASLHDGCQIFWLEGFGKRMATARLMFNNAKLRLTMPEAHKVHCAIIEWNARYSEDRIPDQALGVDPMTAKLMHWIMQSWRRVEFFNTFLAGTVAPRLQMDLIPGLACAAHFVLVANKSPQSIDDYVAAGRAVQRFWLTATQLGLQLQPELTPLIFTRYVRAGKVFSKTGGMYERAHGLAEQFATLVGENNSACAVFMGRIGAGPPALARSTRRPLKDLIIHHPA